MKERFIRIAKPTVILLAIGFTYFLIYRLTGFGLFCPIHRFLGVLCPGCGVSNMCVHLLRMDFAKAFRDNCVLFCLLPVALILLIFHAYRYVRYGERKMYRAEHIGIWTVIAILLVFGVVRNL